MSSTSTTTSSRREVTRNLPIRVWRPRVATPVISGLCYALSMELEVPTAGETSSRRRVFTFEPGGRLWWYVARMALTAFAGALLVAAHRATALRTDDPRAEMVETNFLLAAFAMVVVAPPIETMLMALFFGIATFFSGNVRRLAVVSCVLSDAAPRR